jgi:protein SCO1/2
VTTRPATVAGLFFASILACGFALANPEGRVRIADKPLPLDDFELTDQAGQAFRLSRLRGRSALVFFGFTHCPGICPTALFKLKLLTESLRDGGGPEPAVVMISVDGDRDTPAVLKAYLEPLSEQFIGLTGDPKLVRKIAANFSAVFFKGLPADNSGNYLVDHTYQVYLIDDQGRLRATFFDASVEEMSQATRAIVAKPS